MLAFNTSYHLLVTTSNLNVTTQTRCNGRYPTSAAILIAVVGTLFGVENILGIYTIIATPRLRSAPYYFVCSMAVTDVMVGVASAAASSLILVSKSDAVGDHIADTGLKIMLVIFAFGILSCAHMALIAAERYLFISRPFFHRKYFTNAAILRSIAVFWLFSVIFLCFILSSFFVKNNCRPCERVMPSFERMVVCFVIYISSAVISFVMYGLLTKFAWQQNRHRLKQSNAIRLDNFRDRTTNEGDRFSPPNSPHSQPQNAARRRVILANHRISRVTVKGKASGETQKSIKFFTLVFGIFFLTTLPPILVIAIDSFIAHIPDALFRMMTAPGILYSGVNFVVLYSINPTFKRALKTKLCSSFRKD